jgi:hypothetical protein
MGLGIWNSFNLLYLLDTLLTCGCPSMRFELLKLSWCCSNNILFSMVFSKLKVVYGNRYIWPNLGCEKTYFILKNIYNWSLISTEVLLQFQRWIWYKLVEKIGKFQTLTLYFSRSFFVKRGGIYEIVVAKSLNLTSLIFPLSTFYSYDVVSSFSGIMQTSLMMLVISLAEYPSIFVDTVSTYFDDKL